MTNQTKAYSLENIRKNWLWHIISWLIILLGLYLLNDSSESTLSKLMTEIINVSIYALLVYVNFLFLIPKFLAKKKYFQYIILMTLWVMIVTPFKIIILYYRFIDYNEFQSALLSQKFVFFISSFLVFLLSTVFKVISDWFKHQKQVNELEKQHLASEIKFLKSQINPHFFFNTLNSLYALTLKKSDEAPNTVLKLSEMMRYMLYECNEKTVSLSKEVQYIQNYIDLEKIRHSKNVKIDLTLEGNTSEVYIAPLIYIAFIENSFKHGLRNQVEKGYIKIKFTIDGKNLKFYCENSVNETDSSVKDKMHSGIGLSNVKRRLQLLYPQKYTLEVKKTTTQYIIKLDIELT